MGNFLEIKLKDFEQHNNVDEEERGIVKEMLNDAKKYSENNNDYRINQQLIEHRDLF